MRQWSTAAAVAAGRYHTQPLVCTAGEILAERATASGIGELVEGVERSG